VFAARGIEGDFIIAAKERKERKKELFGNSAKHLLILFVPDFLINFTHR
jgi:hypothetical protein